MTPTEDKRFSGLPLDVTYEEASAALCISHRLVRQLVKARQLDVIVHGHRTRRIPIESIRRYRESRSILKESNRGSTVSRASDGLVSGELT